MNQIQWVSQEEEKVYVDTMLVFFPFGLFCFQEMHHFPLPFIVYSPFCHNKTRGIGLVRSFCVTLCFCFTLMKFFLFL